MSLVTISIRLPKELRQKLVQHAKATKRGENCVIQEALEHYLVRSSEGTLKEEAQRQSLLASKCTPVDAVWAEQDTMLWDV